MRLLLKESSPPKRLELLTSAVALGSPKAMVQLAFLLLGDHGVPRDWQNLGADAPGSGHQRPLRTLRHGLPLPHLSAIGSFDLFPIFFSVVVDLL